MFRGKTPRVWSLLTLLLAYGLLALLPMIWVGAYLLLRVAQAERAQLEERVHQIAEAVAGDVERELQRRLTLLETLATSPRLSEGDFAKFYVQAKAAIEKDNLGVLLQDAKSRQQLVNTFVEYGTPLPTTGDPDTFDRVLASNRPQVSDVFTSLVSKSLAIDIALPVKRAGKAYLLRLALLPDHFRPILMGQKLPARWTLTLLDRRGAIVARSQKHEQVVGTPVPPEQLKEIQEHQRAYLSKNLDGELVMAADAVIPSAGWHVRVGVPLEDSQAFLNRSIWMLAVAALTATLVTMLLGAFFADRISKPLQLAAQMAQGLARGEKVVASPAPYKEANAVVAALQSAASELETLRAHERLVVSESGHRVKNILAVVQSLVHRTMSAGGIAQEVRNTLQQRLQALARAQETLMSSESRGGALEKIVTEELAPHRERIHIKGPQVMIADKLVQTFSLLLHELATNAAKYGALANEQGKVSVTWQIDHHTDPARLTFRWQEKDGPLVEPPTRKGFGSTLLEGAIPQSTSRLLFEPSGFIFELEVPLAQVTEV
jgi:two-component sensor histidine kinase